MTYFEKRPWGNFTTIMDSSKTKIKEIEVQVGSYFGEDDIVRLDDDYNRVI